MGRSTTSSKTGRPRRRELPPELERRLDVRRLVRIGLAVFGVVMIVIAVFILLPTETSHGGPLQDESLLSPTSVGGKRGVDKPVSIGFSLAWNAAEGEAVLDRLLPLSPSSGIEVVGAGILDPAAPAVEYGGGYPPEGSLKPPPVRGYRIPPGSTALDAYQVVVGVEATEAGVQSIAGFAIQYHVGDASYEAIVLHGVWICVPRDEKPACPGKGDLADQQEQFRRDLLPLIEVPSR